MIVTEGILDPSPLRSGRSGSLPVRDSNLYMPRFFSGALFFFGESHLVTLSQRCVYIFQSNPAPPLITVSMLLHYLGRHLLWSQQGTERLHFASPAFVHSHLHPFPIVSFLNLRGVYVRMFCGPLEILFSAAKNIWREVMLLSLFLFLLPRFMWVCMHVRECVPIVWCERSVELVNKKKRMDLCAKAKVWKQSNQTFVQETHFVTYL